MIIVTYCMKVTFKEQGLLTRHKIYFSKVGTLNSPFLLLIQITDILFSKVQKLSSAFDFHYIDFLPLFLQCQRFY